MNKYFLEELQSASKQTKKCSPSFTREVQIKMVRNYAMMLVKMAHIKKMDIGAQLIAQRGWAFALHIANPSLTAGISYGTLSPPRSGPCVESQKHNQV